MEEREEAPLLSSEATKAFFQSHLANFGNCQIAKYSSVVEMGLGLTNVCGSVTFMCGFGDRCGVQVDYVCEKNRKISFYGVVKLSNKSSVEWSEAVQTPIAEEQRELLQ